MHYIFAPEILGQLAQIKTPFESRSMWKTEIQKKDFSCAGAEQV